ncbi:MAG: hypothetical protein HQK53_16925 [Oligoflexia bacterium]|nr:hypothetical protein [Oligoflexia bacterium]
MKSIVSLTVVYLLLLILLTVETPALMPSEMMQSEMMQSTLAWTQIFREDSENIKNLLLVLSKTASGKKILSLASSKLSSVKTAREKKGIAEIIHKGDISTTNTSILRKIITHPSTAATGTTTLAYSYTYSHTIYIDRSLTIVEAVLDLAHELTHYVYRPENNPYQKNFRVKDFIVSTIEGRGGEADAYLVECKVWSELSRIITNNKTHKNQKLCKEMYDARTQKFSKQKIVEEFYKLGGHYRQFIADIELYQLSPQDFPFATAHNARFFSSTYDLPYPLSALYEFQNTLKKVCDNDLKKIKLIKSKILSKTWGKTSLTFTPTPMPTAAASAATAKASTSSLSYSQLEKEYLDRCESTIVEI